MTATPSRFDVIVIGGGPQRPRHRGAAREARPARPRARAARRRRRRGDHRAAVGPRLQDDRAVVRRQPDAADGPARARARAARLQASTRSTATSSPHPDGRCLLMHDDPARRHAQIAKFSRADADAMRAWDAWLGRLGGRARPDARARCRRSSARSGPATSARAARSRVEAPQLDERGVADVTRLMTMSVADLLEERFESHAVRGVLAVSGVIGTWAGPRSPGTAYVMAHHKIGDVGEGQMGTWGFPEGGMGGVTQAMRARRRVVRRDDPHRAPTSSASSCTAAGRPASCSPSGDELDADTWSRRRTRRSRSCATSSAPTCPTTSSSRSSAGRRAAAR